MSFKLYDAICGFVHPDEDDRGESSQDRQFPEVAEVKKRLEEQEVKYDILIFSKSIRDMVISKLVSNLTKFSPATERDVYLLYSIY